jgi:hypothetical protein
MSMPQLPGVGRKVQVGDGYEVTVTENIQRYADDAIHAFILDLQFPAADFLESANRDLKLLRHELREQVPLDPKDSSTEFGDRQIKRIAQILSCWDLNTGKSKSGWAVPIRSTMDIPLAPAPAPAGRELPFFGMLEAELDFAEQGGEILRESKEK